MSSLFSQMLTDPIYRPSQAVHKQSFQSLAKCIAALTVTCQEERPAVVHQFLADVQVRGGRGTHTHTHHRCDWQLCTSSWFSSTSRDPVQYVRE